MNILCRSRMSTKVDSLIHRRLPYARIIIKQRLLATLHWTGREDPPTAVHDPYPMQPWSAWVVPHLGFTPGANHGHQVRRGGRGRRELPKLSVSRVHEPVPCRFHLVVAADHHEEPGTQATSLYLF